MAVEAFLARQLARMIRRSAALFVRPKIELTRLGTHYGGWHVPRSLLKPGNVAICAGAGEDISFDVELNRAGLRVVTVDPTPRAIEHVEGLLKVAENGARYPINRSENEFYELGDFDRSRFQFLPVGVWNEATTMRFYAPRNPDHVSHSILSSRSSDGYFEAECDTVSSIMKKENLERIDIIKLDIECAEYNVLSNMIETKILPACILVEFDELIRPPKLGFLGRVRGAIHALKGAGYRLAHVEGSNYCFIR